MVQVHDRILSLRRGRSSVLASAQILPGNPSIDSLLPQIHLLDRYSDIPTCGEEAMPPETTKLGK
jgi:hypothetical protein